MATLTIADNADGTGGVATISGSSGGSNTVYSQAVNGELGTAAWTSRGSRTGDGTVAVTPGNGFYWWKVVTGGSDTSNLVYQNLTDGSTAIWNRLLAAVLARVQGLSLAGVANDSIISRDVPIDRGITPQGIALPAVVISPVKNEIADPLQGTNQRDDVVYPVGITLFASGNANTRVSTDMLLWRQKIMKAFHNYRIAGVAEAISGFVEPGPHMDLSAWVANLKVSSLIYRCTCRQTRGI